MSVIALSLFLGLSTSSCNSITSGATTQDNNPLSSPSPSPSPSPSVNIVTSSLSTALVGSAFSASLLAENVSGHTFSWAVTSGTLPPGITLAANGSLSGTPTTKGTYTIGFTCTDNNGTMLPATKTITWRVNKFHKLLLIGDSMTSGYSGQYSYRYFFWQRLKDEPDYYSFTLVGTKTGTGSGGSALPADADPDFIQYHEGWWGKSADQIKSSATASLNTLQAAGKVPDIALLIAGHNDVRLATSEGANLDIDVPTLLTTTISDITALVTWLRTYNPNIKIALGTIPPTPKAYNGIILQLNEQIRLLPDAITTEASPVLLVEAETIINPATDFIDSYGHLNTTGDPKLANAFYAVVEDWLKN